MPVSGLHAKYEVLHFRSGVTLCMCDCMGMCVFVRYQEYFVKSILEINRIKFLSLYLH